MGIPTHTSLHQPVELQRMAADDAETPPLEVEMNASGDRTKSPRQKPLRPRQSPSKSGHVRDKELVARPRRRSTELLQENRRTGDPPPKTATVARLQNSAAAVSERAHRKVGYNQIHKKRKAATDTPGKASQSQNKPTTNHREFQRTRNQFTEVNPRSLENHPYNTSKRSFTKQNSQRDIRQYAVRREVVHSAAGAIAIGHHGEKQHELIRYRPPENPATRHRDKNRKAISNTRIVQPSRNQHKDVQDTPLHRKAQVNHSAN